MSVSTHPHFPDLKTMRGGCVACGYNYDTNPVDGVPVCVDLGYADPFEGAVLLCGSCARSVAAQIGYVAPEVAEKLTVSAHDELLIAGQVLQKAEEAARAAARDREVIERVVAGLNRGPEPEFQLVDGPGAKPHPRSNVAKAARAAKS